MFKVISNAELRQGTNFKAWAVTIMRNLFINNYRKKMRRNTLLSHETPNNYFLDSNQVNAPHEGESDATYQDLRMVAETPRRPADPVLEAYQGVRRDQPEARLAPRYHQVDNLLRAPQAASHVRHRERDPT